MAGMLGVAQGILFPFVAIAVGTATLHLLSNTSSIHFLPYTVVVFTEVFASRLKVDQKRNLVAKRLPVVIVQRHA